MPKLPFLPLFALTMLAACSVNNPSADQRETKASAAPPDSAETDAFEEAMRAAEKDADAAAKGQTKTR